MNTKSIPAVLALIAGFVTCIMSFVQRVDIVVFAKRFVIVCIIFFAIGTVISVVLNMNFKDMAADEEIEEESPAEDDSESEQEDVEAEEDDEA